MPYYFSRNLLKNYWAGGSDGVRISKVLVEMYLDLCLVTRLCFGDIVEIFEAYSSYHEPFMLQKYFLLPQDPLPPSTELVVLNEFSVVNSFRQLNNLPVLFLRKPVFLRLLQENVDWRSVKLNPEDFVQPFSPLVSVIVPNVHCVSISTLPHGLFRRVPSLVNRPGATDL